MANTAYKRRRDNILEARKNRINQNTETIGSTRDGRMAGNIEKRLSGEKRERKTTRTGTNIFKTIK